MIGGSKTSSFLFTCCDTLFRNPSRIWTTETRLRTEMSWLPRSIANTLRRDEDEDESPDDVVVSRPAANHSAQVEDRRPGTLLSAPQDLRLSDSESYASDNRGEEEDPGGDLDQGRGVKGDLSEFRDSVTRQLWGVASFLAPPPPLGQRSDSLRLNAESGRSASGSEAEENEELVEYNARLAGHIAGQGNLSSSEDYYEEAVGITDEVLVFAKNIAHHPETWLDFSLSEEEDFDEFDISDVQYKHALAVEHLAPRLAALRIELCPVHMSVGYFWMVYFVLLHSRLNKCDADALSSPQLVKARAMWMQALQKQTKEELYGFGASTFHLKESSNSPRENITMYSSEYAHFGNLSDQISPLEPSVHDLTAEHEIEKHPVNEIEFVDKSVIREDPAPKLLDKEMITNSSVEITAEEVNADDDDDDWLKEDSDLIAYSSRSIMVNEEDISFSDLEDDCTTPIKYKISSAKETITAKSP